MSVTEMREFLLLLKNEPSTCAKHFPISLLYEITQIPPHRLIEFRNGKANFGRTRLMRLNNALIKIKSGQYTFRAEPFRSLWRYVLIEVPETDRKALFTGRIVFNGTASKMVIKQVKPLNSMPTFMDVFTKNIKPTLPSQFKVSK